MVRVLGEFIGLLMMCEFSHKSDDVGRLCTTVLTCSDPVMICEFFTQNSPWYNRNGWLGVKNQLPTYLHTKVMLWEDFAPLCWVAAYTYPLMICTCSHKSDTVRRLFITELISCTDPVMICELKKKYCVWRLYIIVLSCSDALMI